MGSFCSYYDQNLCRSCQWMEVPYSEQLRNKEKVLAAALNFITAPGEQEPSARSPEQGFRNRAKMMVTGTTAKPIIGLTGENQLDLGRELLSCPIHHPRLNELLAALPAFITKHGIEPYRIQERRGELKGLIAFYSPQTRQMLLRFVLRSRESLSRVQGFLPDLQRVFPDLVCVSVNIQPIPHAILEGPEEIILSEIKSIAHGMGDLTFKLTPQAFVQTNVAVATELYQTAARWVAEAKITSMLELYCGQGAFSFFAAPNARQIVGVEINADAVQTANETAQALGLNHLTFSAADATQVGAELERLRPDLVLANPPRRGLGDGVQLIIKHQPRHLIYSSCDAESLAKDLRALAPCYRLRKIRILDMFPHTRHFETLVWLELLNP